MIKYLIPLIPFLIAASTPAIAKNGAILGSDTGIPLKANINLSSVSHKLYQPSDKNAPQPFYKKFCSGVKSHNYKDAKGTGTFWYDPKMNKLWFAFNYSGLSGPPIMMHFHLGKPGVTGPIVQTICGHPPPSNSALGYSKAPLVSPQCPKGTSGMIFGSYVLKGNKWLKPRLSASAEKKALYAGQLYINIHTCLNENGEVRGQIIESK